MQISSETDQNLHESRRSGTLAIDLGSTTTIVAFQGEKESKLEMLELKSICTRKGEVPSILWYNSVKTPEFLVGDQIIQAGLASSNSPSLIKDFKRWIGSTSSSFSDNHSISAERAGEILFHEIWKRIPKGLQIKRLVLTAPVEAYKAYRKWLFETCNDLPVEEIALVDEPTAAAMGAGLPAGSKLLVIDIGGSTTDFSLVALEGGEGKAAPIAELLRFRGKDLQTTSRQTVRSANVLGKAGIRFGGRDIDRWIANYLYPNSHSSEELLNAAERLKCKLSDQTLKPTEVQLEFSLKGKNNFINQPLYLSRSDFEKLLIKKGFLISLEQLLKQTLAAGRRHNCTLSDLKGIVLVGGGSKIPLLQTWLKEKTKPAPLLTPPPVEAVAVGALSLTPGVKVKDVLNKGISLRCWDQRSAAHIWHPLFLPGQTWPTSSGLEIVLSTSKNNQREIELILGEINLKGTNEVIYINGMPTIKQINPSLAPKQWSEIPITINLEKPGNAGDDCLRLKFNIDEKAILFVEGKDLRNNNPIPRKDLGSIR